MNAWVLAAVAAVIVLLALARVFIHMLGLRVDAAPPALPRVRRLPSAAAEPPIANLLAQQADALTDAGLRPVAWLRGPGATGLTSMYIQVWRDESGATIGHVWLMLGRLPGRGVSASVSLGFAAVLLAGVELHTTNMPHDRGAGDEKIVTWSLPLCRDASALLRIHRARLKDGVGRLRLAPDDDEDLLDQIRVDTAAAVARTRAPLPERDGQYRATPWFVARSLASILPGVSHARRAHRRREMLAELRSLGLQRLWRTAGPATSVTVRSAPGEAIADDEVEAASPAGAEIA